MGWGRRDGGGGGGGGGGDERCCIASQSMKGLLGSVVAILRHCPSW